MRAVDLARVLLTQVAEENDSEANYLLRADREAARLHADANASREQFERWWKARCEHLWPKLRAQSSHFQRALWAVQVPIPFWLTLLVAFLLGFLGNEFVSGRYINLLAFPLMVLLVWNVVIYFLVLAKSIFRVESTIGLETVIRRMREAFFSATRSWWGGQGPAEKAWIARSLKGFVERWQACAGKLLALRASKTLHCAAAFFALGVLGAMYWRGFAFAYEATWESTFLETPEVHGLLSFILNPAAVLLRTPFPSLEVIADLQAPQSGEAALWIHLWALTAFLWIVLPRCSLALFAWLRELKLARNLPIPTELPWAMRLQAANLGQGVYVAVQPYSYRPSQNVLEALRTMILNVVGNRVAYSVAEPIAYGESWPATGQSLSEEAQRCIFLPLFNLAQVPEQEVQGDWLAEGIQKLSEQRDVLFPVIDLEPYHKALSGDDLEERLEARKNAWQRILSAVGLQGLFLDCNDSSDQLLQHSRTLLDQAEVRFS